MMVLKMLHQVALGRIHGDNTPPSFLELSELSLPEHIGSILDLNTSQSVQIPAETVGSLALQYYT